MTSSTECPKCGHPNPEGSNDCENCGITLSIFSIEQEKAQNVKEEAEKATAATAEEAKYKIKCLRCGHPNSPITDDCIKCGVIFAKSYESTEHELRDDPDKAVELAELLQLKNRHEELKTQFLEKQKIEAARKEQEEKERLEALRKERERQEALRKEREEKERIEAEKKEAERKRREEKERREAESKAEQERKRQEKLRKEKAEKERIAVLKEIEEGKKRQEENERLEAASREQDEKEQREITRLEKLGRLLKPKATIKKLLKPYIGETVGMNYDVPTVVKTVKLISVNDDYISVHTENDETVFSYPIRNILSIAENVDSITTGSAKNRATFLMIIKVSHRMV